MKRNVSLAVCAVGLLLILVGFFISVPGTYLTTIDSLDGDKSSYHDDRYSSIEEYVGGDAYNYIIGASLIGGEIAGAKAQKAIFISVGALITCIGILAFVNSDDKKKEDYTPVAAEETPYSPAFNNAISSFLGNNSADNAESAQTNE